ncbi:hypothetical protein ZHAS_00022069 [Anopheles sinensis]|uniref:Uncharacterized protein n=1 Tax=Anopheles sinensis TaxID=74873 RepID=A0A084WU00_ANOSI|nr:hypothetical protein ZHAS_00022069 [Anopheles sinensis]
MARFPPRQRTNTPGWRGSVQEVSWKRSKPGPLNAIGRKAYRGPCGWMDGWIQRIDVDHLRPMFGHPVLAARGKMPPSKGNRFD